MIPIPFDYDEHQQITISDDDRELAMARSVILKKLCIENGIAPNEALVAVAVFIGDMLKHQADADARAAINGLFKLAHQTYFLNRKGNGQ